MSFDRRLIHRVAILRMVTADDGSGGPQFDDLNQPVRSEAVLATVSALAQPRSVREIAQLSQAGITVGDHVVFMRPTDITASDVLRFDPDDGRRLQVMGVRDAAGLGHHYEVDAQLVQAPLGATGTGS